MRDHGDSYFGRDLEAMSFAENYHEWVLSHFDAFLQGRIAEVGAGSGNLSRMLLKRTGIRELCCFEPSSNMFPLLEKRLQGESRATCTNGFFGGGEGFDGILYANVLEHVEDDENELRIVHGALRPGGSLLVFVPAGRWLYSDFDRSIGHYRRYTKNELAAKVKSAGFVVQTCRYLDSVGVVPWYLAFVLLRKSLSPGNVSVYDRLVVPWLRRIETVLPPPFGKNLVLVATKRHAGSENGDH
jgi:SAM-dependent methyltransferase